MNIYHHLVLKNGHYTLKSNKSTVLLNGISFKEQNIILCIVDKKNDHVITYNGKIKREIKLQEYYDLSHETFEEDCYVKINKDVITIEEQYKKYMDDNDKLKTATKDLIDLRKCGGKPKNAALKLFHSRSLSLKEPEKINQLEESIILDCFKGAVIFSSKNTTLDYAIEYDLNSAYQSILIRSDFKVPMSEGKFKYIDNLFGDKDYLNYGIYRIIIYRSNDENIDKLFRFNQKNKYTYTDIYTAQFLGLKFELIKDGQSNCLLYESGCIQGSVMFKSFFEKLYELKKNKTPFSKDIISATWGHYVREEYVIQQHMIMKNVK